MGNRHAPFPPIGAQDQTAIHAALDTEIARLVRKDRRGTGIHHKTRLARQGGDLVDTLQQITGDAMRIIARRPIGGDQQVALFLAGGIGLYQPKVDQSPQKDRQAILAYAANLQVGAPGNIHDPMAMGTRQFTGRQHLITRQTPQTRLDTHQPAITRRHRVPGIGAPALDG
ncbi:hypothetical protein KXV85_004632, partial [Aspergillus fumigatus]